MRYDLLAQEAMRGVIRLALERAASDAGLPGEHHFYITFITDYDGVVVPPHLREKYPDEMTIIIKRHYWDLIVEERGFAVGLSFYGKPENIRVPYASVLRFLDPEAQFVLQFPRNEMAPSAPSPKVLPSPSAVPGGAEIVSLDKYRKG